jgi:hypothetical protein
VFFTLVALGFAIYSLVRIGSDAEWWGVCAISLVWFMICWRSLKRGRKDKNYLQVVVSVCFILTAVASGLYSLTHINNDAGRDWWGFFLMSILWIVVCNHSAGKDRKDRKVAKQLKEEPPNSRSEAMQTITKRIEGNAEYQILLWTSAVASLSAVLLWMWALDGGVESTDKALFSMAVLFCVSMCFYFSKLMRDKADLGKSRIVTPAMKKTVPYQVLSVALVLLSIGSLVAVIIGLPVDLPFRLFLLSGSGLVISDTFFLSKLMRDQQDLQEIMLQYHPASRADDETGLP